MPSMSFVAILLLLAFIGFIWRLTKLPRQSPRSIVILVLGDVGRSPRIMYHAQSLAENNFETHVVGYGGSRPISSLENHHHVHFHYLPEPPTFLRHLPFIFAGPFKVIHQIFSILVVLIVRMSDAPEYILVQNPPSIPTLALAQLASRMRGSKLIIDWHNLGYSILALKLGKNHPFVKIAKWFEATFGRFAYAHLFVTRAMHDNLVREWGLRGHKQVLYDRPPRPFHPASDQEVHELFRKLHSTLCAQKPLYDFLPQYSSPHSTPFTYTQPQVASSTSRPTDSHIPLAHGAFAHRAEITTPSATPTPQTALSHSQIHLPVLRPDRPALLVSSTSWTSDEDFDVLLDALNMYELRAQERSRSDNGDIERETLPKVLVIVTGKGPLKDHYMQKVSGLQNKWAWVRCISLWLEAGDYPTLLGSADLGICLHASSSAMDLPMKIVDMFGCGLPVCALEFPCIGELVKEGVNGLVFKDASQLAEQLEKLLLSFPNSTPLQSLRSSLISSHAKPRAGRETGSDWEWSSWDENWNSVMRPLLVQSGKST
ncbi:hypothetical protein AX15_001175 [Amanita polypyramis BW_CC]|nr:hypothetical protein AX15_001175 [Amanita polypyramis BW_CC]